MHYGRGFLWMMLTILLLSSYGSSGQTGSLRKLSARERIEYARNRKFPPKSTIYKDSVGNALKGFDPANPVIEHEVYSASDFFVNPSGKIVEVVVRKASARDKDF